MDNIDHELLSALMEVESSNNPKAFNKATGARGLTQITPVAWQDLIDHHPEKYGKMNYQRDIFKPEVAMQAGQDYLNIIKGYLKHYNIPSTMENILGSYNWGIGNVKKHGLAMAPAETKAYIQKIRHLLQPQADAMMQVR
jgi:soluble lytic murein transglycosylase-like protein